MFSTRFQLTCYYELVTSNHKPTAKAEATRKGVRKVNLNDLKGSMSSRGRKPYSDPELREALAQLIVDGEPFIWETAEVKGTEESEVTSEKAKWRARAVSVFGSLNSDKGISVRWTDANEMVILLKG